MITELTPELVRSAAVCHIECWREAYRGVVPDHLLDAFDVDRLALIWRKRLTGPGRTFVATVDGVVIGFASAGPGPTGALQLHSLYVRSAYYGSGVADELIDAAVGGSACSLWVFEANPRAQAFYRRHGFVLTGERDIERFSNAVEVRMTRTGSDPVQP